MKRENEVGFYDITSVKILCAVKILCVFINEVHYYPRLGVLRMWTLSCKYKINQADVTDWMSSI